MTRSKNLCNGPAALPHLNALLTTSVSAVGIPFAADAYQHASWPAGTAAAWTGSAQQPGSSGGTLLATSALRWRKLGGAAWLQQAAMLCACRKPSQLQRPAAHTEENVI